MPGSLPAGVRIIPAAFTRTRCHPGIPHPWSQNSNSTPDRALSRCRPPPSPPLTNRPSLLSFLSSLNSPKQGHILPAQKTFSSFCNAIRQETRSAAAATRFAQRRVGGSLPYLAAAPQVLSHAGGPRLPGARWSPSPPFAGRLPPGVQEASVLGPRAHAPGSPSVHRAVFPEALSPPGRNNERGDSEWHPLAPLCALRGPRALRPRVTCRLQAAASAPAPAPVLLFRFAAPGSGPGPLHALAFTARSFPSVPPSLFPLLLSSSLLSCILFFHKLTCGAPRGGESFPPQELFLCLVVAVVATAGRSSYRSSAPPPPGLQALL